MLPETPGANKAAAFDTFEAGRDFILIKPLNN